MQRGREVCEGSKDGKVFLEEMVPPVWGLPLETEL